MVGTTASYFEGRKFKSRPEDRLSCRRFPRFTSIRPGKCWDSTLNHATATSVPFVYNSLFTNHPTRRSCIIWAVNSAVKPSTNKSVKTEIAINSSSSSLIRPLASSRPELICNCESYRRYLGLFGRGISPSQTQTQKRRWRTSMPRVVFEPKIPVFERAKPFRALDQWYSTWGTGTSGGTRRYLRGYVK
jgi:hypothetical protein